MDIEKILTDLTKRQTSDVFIVAGRPIACKIKGRLVDYDQSILTAADTKKIAEDIYSLANSRNMHDFEEHGDDDFSFSIRGVARFRTNVYKQRGSYAAVIRIVQFELPEPASLSIPEEVLKVADIKKGLVLVTGVGGCGKSTTLACIIDRINSERFDHIVTLEDPIEYLHPHKKSVISQREISLDTDSYSTALRACLRQSPDVILIGELRDAQTAEIAMTAAETGHMVITTMHTMGSANTIDRIIDLYPNEKQAQARLQLSMVLSEVISQQLVETVSGDIIPAFEIMKANPAIRNLIREAKTHQIEGAILSARDQGMITMDTYLNELFTKGLIDEETYILKASDPAAVQKRMRK